MTNNVNNQQNKKNNFLPVFPIYISISWPIEMCIRDSAWSASAARKARPGYVPTPALIAPILPVLLLVIFNVPIILGFIIGSFYALIILSLIHI